MAEYPQPDTATESRIKSKAPLREKAGEELREFIVLTAYLYICFAAVIYFKAAVLQAHDVAYAHVGLAIVKAAICAKFMLIGRVFHIGERFKNLPLIVPTLHRSFVFLLLLAVLEALRPALTSCEIVHLLQSLLDSASYRMQCRLADITSGNARRGA